MRRDESHSSLTMVFYRFGIRRAGKSVIIADLLAQIGHRFGFRLIVEEGLSHAVLTQTQGSEPVIINPNGCFAIVKVVAINTTLIVVGWFRGLKLVATDGAVARAGGGFGF
jgi:hypothetical protein